MHFFAVVATLLVAGPAAAQPDLPTVAVLNLESRTTSPAELDALSDRLRLELFRTGMFQVMERERMDAILEEQGFQTGECVATECIIEVGQLVGVTYIVAGKVSRVGSVLSITARMISVETGTIQRTALRDCSCELEEVLTRVLREVAGELAGNDPAPDEPPTPTRQPIESAESVESSEEAGEPRKGSAYAERRLFRNSHDDYISLGILGLGAGWMMPLEGRSDIGFEFGGGMVGDFRGLNAVGVWNIHLRPHAEFDPYLQVSFGLMTGQRNESAQPDSARPDGPKEWKDRTFAWPGLGLGMRYGRYSLIFRVMTIPVLAVSRHF